MVDRVPLILLIGADLASRSRTRWGALVISTTAPEVARNGAAVQIDAMTRRFFAALAARSPGVVSSLELIDVLWGDDPEGGPDNATGLLSQLAQRARFLSAALGVVVETVCGRGYYLRAVKADAVAETRALAQLEEMRA